MITTDSIHFQLIKYNKHDTRCWSNEINSIWDTTNTEWSRYQTWFAHWEPNIYHVWLPMYTSFDSFQVTRDLIFDICESIFIYEHSGRSHCNGCKSNITNQYSTTQRDQWLPFPLTMIIQWILFWNQHHPKYHFLHY